MPRAPARDSATDTHSAHPECPLPSRCAKRPGHRDGSRFQRSTIGGGPARGLRASAAEIVAQPRQDLPCGRTNIRRREDLHYEIRSLACCRAHALLARSGPRRTGLVLRACEHRSRHRHTLAGQTIVSERFLPPHVVNTSVQDGRHIEMQGDALTRSSGAFSRGTAGTTAPGPVVWSHERSLASATRSLVRHALPDGSSANRSTVLRKHPSGSFVERAMRSISQCVRAAAELRLGPASSGPA